MLTVILAADKLRVWVPTTLLSASMVPFATVSLCFGAVSWILPKKLWTWLDNKLYSTYMRLTLFVFEGVSEVEIHLYGDVAELKHRKESVVVISNHQSNVDWAVINMLAARQSPDGFEYGLRFVVKYAIHFVPLFGWYIFQHGYIYVRRFGAFVPDPVLRQFEHLRTLGEPFWLHIFPEGTRFTHKKPSIIANSKAHAKKAGLPVPEFTLVPRMGAVTLTMKELRPVLDAVYDVTIAYGQTRLPKRVGLAPNMFEFVSGLPDGKQVHIHIKRFPISEIPSEKEAVKHWLQNRFVAKDELMRQFYETGCFPEVYEKRAAKTSFCRTIVPFLAFTGGLVLPIFSQRVRRAYLITLATSPALILWLHIRKCV
uniref:Phospholipid/glycerol acyltransferase domain-containing protein n=1 Tax=Panagrolaimus sp. JU765 TaxID=591449 RepID=A0AC34QWC0_9BILA